MLKSEFIFKLLTQIFKMVKELFFNISYLLTKNNITKTGNQKEM